MSLPHPPHPTHTHYTEYADPVLRPPSPASSVGTAYGADHTSLSDSEQQIPQTAFERKWEERMGLENPREEEVRADLEPLLMVPAISGSGQGPGMKMVRVTERRLEPTEEKAIFDRILTSLRAEIAHLQENELFEQILLRGSKAALETQPSTNDIDALMRSMMGPAMSLGGASGSKVTGSGPGIYHTQAHLGIGRSNSGGSIPQPQLLQHPQAQVGAFTLPPIPPGPLPADPNAYPNPSVLTTPMTSALPLPLPVLIGGKRSRNGTNRPARNS